MVWLAEAATALHGHRSQPDGTNTMIDPARQTPILVLTGFLGAGKSTLLRQLLAAPTFANSGVIINEFGDVAVDHDLVAAGLPQITVTSTGCLCCTAGSDIRASVAELHEAAKKAGRLPLDRIVIETTGLADMAPVVNQLVAGAVPAFGLRDHTVARNYRLAGVVALFDALEGEGTLKRHAECVKQLAFADRILVSKLDLVAPEDRDTRLAGIASLVREISPHAPLHSIHAADFDLAAAFAPRPYAPQDLGNDLADWLDETAGHHHDDHHHDHDHDHHGHHHHANADGTFGVGSFAIVRDAPIDKGALSRVLDLVGLFHGPNLLRLKGIVAFADEPDTPYVIQVVQHAVHPLQRLDAWPGSDHRTRLVAITHGVDPAALEAMMTSMLNGTDAEAPPLPETIRL